MSNEICANCHDAFAATVHDAFVILAATPKQTTLPAVLICRDCQHEIVRAHLTAMHATRNAANSCMFCDHPDASHDPTCADATHGVICDCQHFI